MKKRPPRTAPREARERIGLSLEEAAKLAGLRPSTLRQYERQGVDSYFTARILANIYQTRIDVFR